MPFHPFKHDDGRTYGSFEVFYIDVDEVSQYRDEEDQPREPGWYWWACFPGCLPDSEPVGPFSSEEEAVRDVNGEN
jgi:hypothetical protein